MKSSALWHTLIAQGCHPLLPLSYSPSSQDEIFKRVADLTRLIFTEAGIRPESGSDPAESEKEEEESDQEDEEPADDAR